MEDFELAERLVKIANKLLEADCGEDHDEGEEKEAESHDEEKEAAEVKAEDEEEKEAESQDEEKAAAAEGGRAEYKKYFDGKLDKYKIDSPAELSDEDKKKFFEDVDKGWKSDEEGSTASDDSEKEAGDDSERVSSDNEIAMQILEIAKAIQKGL